MLEYELPYPPTVNHYWRRVGRRTLISAEGRAFRAKVCSALRAVGVRPMLGPIEVQVELYPPDRRRRDVDNALKSLLDALEKAGAYRDDGQVVHLDVRRCEPVEGGRCIVRIDAVADQAQPGGARRILRGTPMCPGPPPEPCR